MPRFSAAVAASALSLLACLVSCSGAGASAVASDVRAPLPAIELALSAGERARFTEVPIRRGAIPVLLFHQICPESCRAEDEYAMTRNELARTLAMLEHAGYTTISIADYVRFLHGATEGLPPRPILLTFDDSRADAWVGAHAILAKAKARATMYVITANTEAEKPDYMTWGEIAAAAASGTWDIQLHAHAGHSHQQVAWSADGSPVMRHAYAWRRFESASHDASSGLESFVAWRSRVVTDLETGDALLAAHVPGYVSSTFAVPYSDFGQVASNDVRIEPALRSVFDDRFEVWFSQPGPDPDFTLPGSHQEKFRYVVYRPTTAEQIHLWLVKHASQ